MSHRNTGNQPDYIYWAKLSKWNIREAALLLQDREPVSLDDYKLECMGLGTKISYEAEKNIRWLSDASEHDEATPLEFIALAAHCGHAFPKKLKDAVKKHSKSKPKPPQKTVAYTTPYLELMKQAVSEHNITAENQPKKAYLFEKFLEKEVAGKKVSKNIADAMATLIRLPESQAGAGKPKKNG